MLLRRSETVLRLLVGLALGFGFVGFAASHGQAVRAAHGEWNRPAAALQLHAQAPATPDVVAAAAALPATLD